MKIFLVDFFVHHVEYTGYLGRYLLEEGHEVTFATWQRDDKLQPLSEIGLNLRYVGESHPALAAETLRMIPQFEKGLRNCLKISAKESAAIVHFLYLDRAILLPLWWKTLWHGFHVPVFGTLDAAYHFIDSPNLSPPEELYHTMVRKALKNLLLRGKLAYLFVPTERIKDVVLRALGTKCLEDRILVVPIALPDPMPDQHSSKLACRVQLGLPQDRIVLLFFGELRENKGPDVLLEAVHSLPAEVLVLFAGASMGSFARDWEQEVRIHDLDGQVRLDLGHVPDELVSVYIQAADAIVLPYRRSFLGVSGVLQWAAAARKPVITTDVGELGDLVTRYRLGLVVEPEDPKRLAEAIGQYVRQRHTIENSVKEFAPRYSALNHWRQTGASVLAAYQCVVLG